MNEERKKAKKRLVGLFLLYLCIDFACFGFVACNVIARRESGFADVDVEIYKIIVLTGVFFLVLDFGYALPNLVKIHKAEKGGHDSSEIFDELNMRKALEQYIPDGESLLAGIHAVSRETCIKAVFGGCVLGEDRLIPGEEEDCVALSKEKYAAYDLYLGITQTFLMIVGCERNQYYYRFDSRPNVDRKDAQQITSELLLSDIGTCFPLADIQNCEIKNGRRGSIKCFITMKNGSYFKLLLPKYGGMIGGMPHHTEYRERIVRQLTMRS